MEDFPMNDYRTSTTSACAKYIVPRVRTVYACDVINVYLNVANSITARPEDRRKQKNRNLWNFLGGSATRLRKQSSDNNCWVWLNGKKWWKQMKDLIIIIQMSCQLNQVGEPDPMTSRPIRQSHRRNIIVSRSSVYVKRLLWIIDNLPALPPLITSMLNPFGAVAVRNTLLYRTTTSQRERIKSGNNNNVMI